MTMIADSSHARGRVRLLTAVTCRSLRERESMTGRTTGAFQGQVNAGVEDVFARVMDLAGNILLTYQVGSSSQDFANGVDFDAQQNVVMAGHTFGTLPGQTSSGNVDIFTIQAVPEPSSAAS